MKLATDTISNIVTIPLPVSILISFLLESLLLAAVGGVLGLLLGYAVNGTEQTSIVSGGQGSGKTVVFKMIVVGFNPGARAVTVSVPGFRSD